MARALGRWEPRLQMERVKVVSVIDGKVTLQLSGKYLGDDVVLEASA